MSIYPRWHYTSAFVHILNFSKSMLSHSYLFLYYVIYYVYVHVYMLSLGMHMYMCMQSIEKDVQCLPVLLSTLFFKTKFLSKLGIWHSDGWSQMCFTMAPNWDLNFGVHVLRASPVPTELSLRSLTFYQHVCWLHIPTENDL